jgi:hypothetical protein
VATPIESVLSDELDNFANVDRKQQSMKQKHRIELSRNAIPDEQDIACDSKSAQRQYRIHAKGRENGERCQKSQVIDPRHWGDTGDGSRRALGDCLQPGCRRFVRLNGLLISAGR